MAAMMANASPGGYLRQPDRHETNLMQRRFRAIWSKVFNFYKILSYKLRHFKLNCVEFMIDKYMHSSSKTFFFRNINIINILFCGVIAEKLPRFIMFIFCAVLVFSAYPIMVVADDNVAGPFFDKISRSYFELRKSAERRSNPWLAAKERAARKVYKGAHGRLAVVDTKEIHDFIVRNFKLPGPTWIGLRYSCRTKKLQWVDGTEQNMSKFSPWFWQWYRNSHINCFNQTSMDFMGVYYMGGGTYFWQAAGQKKHFPYYIVQYKLE